MDSFKIQNVSKFDFEESAAKKHKFFICLKGPYFVMSGSIDMNVTVFWENSISFLKSAVLQLFIKYSQNYATTMVIIFWECFKFDQILFSPQVQRSPIIRTGIYELPHELPNDLRLKDLRKLGKIRIISKLHGIIT